MLRGGARAIVPLESRVVRGPNVDRAVCRCPDRAIGVWNTVARADSAWRGGVSNVARESDESAVPSEASGAIVG